MANDKYDAFPRAIIILLLDLFLVCRWQRATFWRLRRDEARRDAREHRLERYKRVRRTRGTRTRRGEPPTAASPSPLRLSAPPCPAFLPAAAFVLSLFLTSFSLSSSSSPPPPSPLSFVPSLVPLPPYEPSSTTGHTDATTEILIINSIPFVTRSIYFGAQRSLRRGLGSARF